MTREVLAVPRAEFRSYYGRQVLKSPAWNWMIAAYLFSGGLSAGSAMLAPGAAAGVAGRFVGEHSGELGLLGSGLGSAGALPSHVAGGEAEFADEHGDVDLVGVWPGRGVGWGCGVAAVSIAADMARPADGMVGETGRTMGGWDGTGGRIVYRSSVVADRGSGVA